jgi:hypothetical protein
MASTGVRVFVVVVGGGICLFAGLRLSQAVQHALATGTVLIGDTKPMSRGVVYPYPWREAWSFFAGWSLVAVGGVLVALASAGRWWLLLVAMLTFFGGRMLIAAAPMLGSTRGVFLLTSVWVGGSLLALAFALWRSARDHRRLQMEPELQDRKRSENTV